MRGHFDNGQSEPEERLLKSERRHVYHICWCLFRQLGRKKSLLLICKVLKLFFNALIKVQFQRTPWQAAWLSVTSTVQIWSTQPLTVIDHCEGNCNWGNLSYSYAKSWNCSLRHWLEVANILFVIETIYGSHLRCSYFRNKKYFLNFFCSFLKSTLNFERFPKKGEPHSWFISEIKDPEKGV